MSDLEAQKKEILPFLQRADEVQSVDAKVAYYCRLAAVDQALKLPQRAQPMDDLLVALLKDLERQKQGLQLDPQGDRQHCERFARKIFASADKADRAGLADKVTANKYYVSSFFFAVLEQFGELSPGVVSEQRYAAWKAADIRKALREGRQPAPGPPSAALPDLAMEDLERELDSVGNSKDSVGSGEGISHPAPPPSTSVPPPGSPSVISPPAGSLPALSPAASPSERQVPMGRPPQVFSRGQRVLVRQGHQEAPLKGTVAEVETGGSPHRYMVGLPHAMARITEADLAPDLPSNARVSVRLMAGPVVHGTIKAAHQLQWPVLYDFFGDDEQERTVDAKQILLPAADSANTMDEGSSDVVTTPKPVPPIASNISSEPKISSAPPPPTSDGETSSFSPSLKAILEAQKLAKHAQSALGFDDVQNAVRNLQEALRLLTGSQA